jgi:hypothetical protein
LIKYDESTKITWVEGLNDVLKRCYQEWKLPHEIGVEWARAGKTMDLRGYQYFKGDDIG